MAKKQGGTTAVGGTGSGPSLPRVHKSEDEPKRKVKPIEFFRQVRQEAAKVTWPTRKETLITTAMVFVVSTLFAIFFTVVDLIIRTIVGYVLG